MRRFRALYGSGPLHLLAVLASLAISGYAVSLLAQYESRWQMLLWFAGAVLLHDLVVYPLYTGLDRLARGQRPAGAVNYVRVPVLLSGILLAMFAPLILTLSPDTYEAATGLEPPAYLQRWLAISAVLFLGAALLYAVRARRSGDGTRRAARETTAQAPHA